jgi:sialic acid synthase SpsE
MEIVAEFSYNHFGNIDRAKKMIDAAQLAGATCVKFELRNNNSYFRNNTEIRSYREPFEFSDLQIKEFAKHCEQLGIGWFASLHDLHSLSRIMQFKPRYLKIASREARCEPFLNKVKEVNNNAFPVVISTGGLSCNQIENIYSLFGPVGLTLVHTSCLYPCDTSDLNMNRIKWMMKNFKSNTGYSGHETGFLPSIYATVLGVNYLERHFTLEEDEKKIAKGKSYFNDELCTLTPDAFANMVNHLNLVLQLRDQPIAEGANPHEMERVCTYGVPAWDGNDVFLLPVQIF